jgi:hypothetical protein
VRRAVRLAVGIPTRNRADLAMAAVDSVLRARDPGVTVVVSDNSTRVADRDRLAEFCAGQPTGAVEYVRPPESLEMSAHWEWLLSVMRERVDPTHVSYVTDRMVFTAGALTELMEIVASEPSRVLSYHHDRVHDVDSPVELVQTQWTGQLLELDTRRLIELSSRGGWGDYLPRMLNSIAPIATVEAIERAYGNVFLSVSPDYCFAYRCLATCDTILYRDRACLIEYGMARSAGISYARGRLSEDAARFRRELSVPRFGATPDPAFETVANAIWQEYCTARNETGGDRFPSVDSRHYLTTHAISVDRMDESEWRAHARELLRRRGWTRWHSARHVLSQTLAIAGYFIRHPGAFLRSVKRQVWDRPPGTPLASLLSRAGLNPRVREDLKFASAAAAIAYADAHPRARTPYAWHVHRLSRAGAIVRRFQSP